MRMIALCEFERSIWRQRVCHKPDMTVRFLNMPDKVVLKIPRHKHSADLLCLRST